MTKKIFTIICFFVFSIYIVLSHPSSVAAANYGLSLDPPLLRVHIKPGKSITQVYKIENLGNTDKTLVASIVPFTDSDDSGNPLLNPKATAPWLSYFGLANSNIKLGEPFNLAAGATNQLVLSLTIPETATPQDIYATLIISTYANSVDQAFQGTSVRATLGSNLLITINSQAYPDTILKIENFRPIDSSFIKIGNLYFVDSISPLRFTATVKNDGNYLAETKGIFRVTKGNNTPVYLEGILPVNVIAKSQRQLLNTNGENFEFSPSLNNIGPHKITLEIKTDNSNTSGTIDLFIFPLKLSLGFFIAVIIIVLIVKISSKPPQNTY